MIETPRILIEFDAESGEYTLMCESYSRVAPAGPRLFRAPPHPPIAFRHETQAGAEKDAALLRHYLANVGKKQPSARAMRQEWA